MAEDAIFEDHGTLQKCADPGFNEACKPLLIELGVYDKVVCTVPETLHETEFLQILTKQRITYNVLRFRKSNTAQSRTQPIR